MPTITLKRNMMENLGLCVLLISEWFILSSCLPRQYHFVNQSLSWNQAQTYCKEKFTDLAAVTNQKEFEELSSKITTETWFGLYGELNWRWSDGFEESGADYRSWKSYEPNNVGGEEFCGCSQSSGNWWDYYCTANFPFLCYRGQPNDPQFVFVNQLKTWSDAQTYCRENFVDLVTIKNDTENQRMASIILSGTDKAWIGLNRVPILYWSDQSNFTYMNEMDVPNPNGSLKVSCGYTSPKESYKWKFSPCSDKRPFICQGQAVPDRFTKQVVKLKMTLKDSSLDLNDENVKAQILKQLQLKMAANNVTGVTLKWREHPDGKTFYKV